MYFKHWFRFGLREPVITGEEGADARRPAGRLLGVQRRWGGGGSGGAAGWGEQSHKPPTSAPTLGASAGEAGRSQAQPHARPTHQLGALVRAVAGEDEARLLRGDGHHRRVHQAQLHDARVEAPQRGRVVQADARGVAPAWEEEGRR